ncbi:MAG TPA: globin [Gemmatimonadales bacterium]|nr:globin [Gemmatimonadales bacterium]
MSQPAGGETGVPAAMALAKASYERCSAGPAFFRAFYDDFFARCPEAKARFTNTDFERQNKLLQHAFGLLLLFPTQPHGEPGLLTRIAERHSRRDLDVRPALYSPFIDSLIATVRRYDAQFTPTIERAWRETLAPGVAYMQARY